MNDSDGDLGTIAGIVCGLIFMHALFNYHNTVWLVVDGTVVFTIFALMYIWDEYEYRKNKALYHIEPLEPKEVEVIVTPNTAQIGILDEFMTELLSKPQKWRTQREIEEVRGSLQVELLRLKGLGILAQRKLEIEQWLLKRKDTLERERVGDQIVGELKTICEVFERIEDILNATELRDPEFQSAVQRFKQRIIEEMLNERWCK